MRRISGLLLAVLIIVLASDLSALAANQVRVESVTLPRNHKDTIGIYIDNDVPIASLVLPLEIRTVSGGAFVGGFNPIDSNVTRFYNTAGRLHNSALGANNPNGAAATIVQNYYRVPQDTGTACGGLGNRYRFATVARTDLISPDAFMLATVSQADPTVGEDAELFPGADAAGVPSYFVSFRTNNSPGTFEIDTCCILPANHLVYTDLAAVEIMASFTKGVITVDANSAVKELETGTIPQDYELEQNYPNPFNAGTVIRFKLPTDGDVKIDVYNILGRKVRTLVNEFRVAGTHQTDWDGRSDDGTIVATGVYFYRIQAGDFTSTRKMVLMK